MADTSPTSTPTSSRLGPRALRVEVADVAQALSLARFVREARVAADEVVPGARTVVLEGVSDLAGVEALLASWSPDLSTGEPGPLVEIPVTYDGEDLADVADRWGCLLYTSDAADE